MRSWISLRRSGRTTGCREAAREFGSKQRRLRRSPILRRCRYRFPRPLALQVCIRVERGLLAAALDVVDEGEQVIGDDADMDHLFDAALAQERAAELPELAAPFGADAGVPERAGDHLQAVADQPAVGLRPHLDALREGVLGLVAE